MKNPRKTASFFNSASKYICTLFLKKVTVSVNHLVDVISLHELPGSVECERQIDRQKDTVDRYTGEYLMVLNS
jgi:hypothetical protein